MCVISPEKKLSVACKSPGNLFPKKGTNPDEAYRKATDKTLGNNSRGNCRAHAKDAVDRS